MTDQYVLSKIDLTSPVWIKLEAFLADRLTKMRARNDNDLSPEETAQVRGEIAAIKSLLKLGREPMPPIDG